MGDFYKLFLEYVKTNFPIWHQVTQNHHWSENLLSPHIIELPKSLLSEFQNIINSFQKLRESQKYIHTISQICPWISFDEKKHYSVLMGYDFHLTTQGFKLIEINTNASHITTSTLLAGYQGLCDPKTVLNTVVESFFREHQLQTGLKKINKLAIVDQKPQEQRAYYEFLIFKNLFESHGVPTDIVDITEVKSEYDFIYNRHTDFYLNRPESHHLKESFQNPMCTVSPSPIDYGLLADKSLFQIWQKMDLCQFGLTDNEAKKIVSVLPKTYDLTPQNSDETWTHRSRYYFKPGQSHGGKGVYQGSKISRKKFSELIHSHYWVQEEVPPALFATKEHQFKYDVRVYAYRNEIQFCMPRLFIGQTVNTQTLGGGIGCIKWT